MALTVFETSEQQQQLLPCQQAGDGGKAAAAGGGAAEKDAATLKETDHGGDGDRPAERAAIWNMIQAQKPAAPAKQAAYVHPLVRRSSSLLTQKSLEICTESLGSETGSDGFSDADGSATDRSDDDDREEESVVAPRAPPPPSRAFPPPLPSLARRKVESTMEMRQERQDGRLLVRVVPVTSSTLFRAQRRGGRLLLSFADTAAPAAADESRGQVEPDEQQADEHDEAHEEEEVEEDEEEQEVEVVDRGTVVEFKVSTQPQARSGSGTRVRRSSLVINKFVGAEPAATCGEIDRAPRRCSTAGSTTTAVAALAAASVLSATAPPPGNGEEAVPGATCGENKLLMTAKRRSSKEELLNNMRRCNQLRGQLFFWEPRIATSS
ncbi:unnamed protein product [Urochloa decumbens]|uniref:FAF domain-containing protein n=1 Tax=Urochloa decumbens TaxID=240449 RepID=A0ABC8XQ99_9POAL